MVLRGINTEWMRQSQGETALHFLPQLSHDGGLPGQWFGEIGIKNRIKLKVAQQQATTQQKQK